MTHLRLTPENADGSPRSHQPMFSFEGTHQDTKGASFAKLSAAEACAILARENATTGEHRGRCSLPSLAEKSANDAVPPDGLNGHADALQDTPAARAPSSHMRPQWTRGTRATSIVIDRCPDVAAAVPYDNRPAPWRSVRLNGVNMRL
jgi:hypothetical protein